MPLWLLAIPSALIASAKIAKQLTEWAHQAVGRSNTQPVADITSTTVTDVIGLPRVPDGSFVGRLKEVGAIDLAFASGNNVVILGGGPGIGKSRLALEYASRNRSHVFWTVAQANTMGSIARLAPFIGIDTDSGNESELAQRVVAALPTIDPLSLWVIDNVPDMAQAMELVSSTGETRLLMTTRDLRSHVRPKGVGFVEISPIDQNASISILCSRGGVDPHDPVLPDLAEAVGNLPLALEQLAIALATPPARTSGELLQLITESPNPEMLSEFREGLGVTLPREAGVFVTLSMALNRLSNEARERISAFGYIADAPLSIELATAVVGTDAQSMRSLLDEWMTHGIAAIGQNEIVIHSLTINAIRASNSPGNIGSWITPISDYLVDQMTTNNPLMRREVDHLVALVRAAKQEMNLDHFGVLKAQQALADIHGELGRFQDSVQLSRECLEASRRTLGNDHSNTMAIANNLAIGLDRAGQYDEAASVLRETLDTLMHAFGPEHDQTLATSNNLAITLDHLGRYEESASVSREALDIRTRVFGPDHDGTLRAVSTLANTLQGMGEYVESEQLHRKVLAVRLRVLGDEHVETLGSKHNIGVILKRMGRTAEARAIMQEVVNVKELLLGPEHPVTLYSLDVLANILFDERRFKESVSLHRRVMESLSLVLGPEHPETLGSMNNLANSLGSLDQFAEAIQLLIRCVEIRENTLGVDHPSTIQSRQNLDRWQEAAVREQRD